MGEVCRQMLRISVIRYFVFLSVIWILVASDGEQTNSVSNSASNSAADLLSEASSTPASESPPETPYLTSSAGILEIPSAPISGSPKDANCGMGFSGTTYMGTRNVTRSGKACQAWTSNSPHQVDSHIIDNHISDYSKEEAKNFCRNPTKKSGIWCYTMDPLVEWELCDPCPENYGNYRGCTLADKGASYTGTLDHSMSHSKCEPWSNHPNSEFKFPDGSEQKAKNYCRNPQPKTYLAPWCYIKAIGGVDWDYCDICKPFQGEVTQSIGSYSRKPRQPLQMNGLSCISWCINYLTCVAVVIPHNGGNECFYITSITGDKISDSSKDQYEISRKCISRTEGRAAYFIASYGRRNSKAGSEKEAPSEYDCTERCINDVDCVLLDYHYAHQACSVAVDDKGLPEPNEDVDEGHIARCSRSLQTVVNSIPPAAKLSQSDTRAPYILTAASTSNRAEYSPPSETIAYTIPTATSTSNSDAYSSPSETIAYTIPTAASASISAADLLPEAPSTPAPVQPLTDKISSASISAGPETARKIADRFQTAGSASKSAADLLPKASLTPATETRPEQPMFKIAESQTPNATDYNATDYNATDYNATDYNATFYSGTDDNATFNYATTVVATKKSNTVLLYVLFGLSLAVCLVIGAGVLICCYIGSKSKEKTDSEGKDSGERQTLLDKKPDKPTSSKQLATAGSAMSLHIIQPTPAGPAVPLQTMQSTPAGPAMPLQTIQPTHAGPAVPLQPIQSTPAGPTHAGPAVPLQPIQSTPAGPSKTVLKP